MPSSRPRRIAARTTKRYCSHSGPNDPAVRIAPYIGMVLSIVPTLVQRCARASAVQSMNVHRRSWNGCRSIRMCGKRRCGFADRPTSSRARANGGHGGSDANRDHRRSAGVSSAGIERLAFGELRGPDGRIVLVVCVEHPTDETPVAIRYKHLYKRFKTIRVHLSGGAPWATRSDVRVAIAGAKSTIRRSELRRRRLSA